MCKSCRHQYDLLILLLGLLSFACVASANSNGSNLISPVSSFETALKASSASGTIVAIKAYDTNKDPCIILVSKAVKNTLQKKERPLNKNKKENLDIHTKNSVCLSEGPLSSSLKTNSLFHLLRCHDYYDSHACIIGITGFTPDAQHILRFTVKSLSDHKYVYSGAGSSGVTSNIIKRQIVDPISDRLKTAALSESGRPFGIQALIVGLSLNNHREEKEDDHHPACFYSIDPSGGWRSWGGLATAIGNRAELTRRSLWIQIRDLSDKKIALPMEEALQIAMKALLTPNPSDEQNESSTANDVDLEQLEAIVIACKEDSKCIFLDTPFLQNIYQKDISLG